MYDGDCIRENPTFSMLSLVDVIILYFIMNNEKEKTKNKLKQR